MPTVTDRQPNWSSFVRAFAALVLLGASGGATAQTNINSSFEDTEAGVVTDLVDGIEGWDLEVNASVSPAPEFAVVDDVAHTGEKSLRVAVAATGDNAYDIQAIGTPVSVEPGKMYRYTVWARADATGATAAFTVGNQAFSEYGSIRDNVNLTTEWQEYTFDFTITDEETVIRAPIHFSFAGNVGTAVYIDDLTVVDPEAEAAAAVPVIVEAEGGTLGSDFVTGDDPGAPGTSFIEIGTPLVDGDFPGANRTASYEVTFPGPGTFDLFARVYVGPATFDDDSFFYGSDFGDRDPTLADDWTIANQLASAGYAQSDDVVRGLGAEQSEIWKWVNISGNNFNGVPADSFTVTAGNLTQTFEIGARENGLRFDKLAFGLSSHFYTVANLDNGEAGSPTDPGTVFEPTGPPLADGLGRFVGNVYSNAQRPDYEFYWNQVTPENAGKWGSVEGVRDVMNWGQLDAAYELAKDNDWPFRFHILIWGAQQPTWMADLEPAEQLEEIEEWFQAVADRYPDIDYLEVVNEPLHDPPDCEHPGNQGTNCASSGDYIDALGGYGDTGWDWIITAFEMAREIFPEGTPLVLNDYGILSSLSSAAQYREIVELLQARDLIDVVGMQGHAFSTRTGAPITPVLNLLAETGLPIMITEFDVDGNPNSSGTITDEQSDTNQLRDMERIFPQFWEHPSVTGITLWGWRPGHWRTEQDAFLVQVNGEERPALVWLRQYLVENGNVANEDDPAASAALLSAAPNPFSATTRITYQLPESADVRLAVYDLLGRRVVTLADGPRAAGDHTTTFDATGLAGGTYLVRLQAGAIVSARTIVVVR